MTRYTTFEGDLQERLANRKFKKLYERELRELRLGYQIAELRRKSRLTQKELARRLGTSQGAVTRLESGRYVGYSLRTLEKIAMATGTRLDVRFRSLPGSHA